jgi:hypothetical protein
MIRKLVGSEEGGGNEKGGNEKPCHVEKSRSFRTGRGNCTVKIEF